MPESIELKVRPEEADSLSFIKLLARKNLGINENRINHIEVVKRSIDARKRAIKIVLKCDVYLDDEEYVEEQFEKDYPNVAGSDPVVIVGAGPAGLFAALRLIELGLRPVIIERGKNVKDRRRDLAAINKEHIVNPESNYCFGEGGAGTYSDGKLYTRSKKRGDVRKILSTLVKHGASKEILVNAHPHIGTNKLPEIIVDIRETIIACGGEVRFNSKVTDLLLTGNKIKGVELSDGERIEGKGVILATGHSARDIYHLLKRKQIDIESKPFALGVRVEHPQELIDKLQYKCDYRGEFLPPAPYSLVHQVGERGVFSFCMCPGGIIAPCATSPGEVVTNGWSPSKRNNPYANSGVVVSVNQKDFKAFEKEKELSGMFFQASVEKKAWELGGKTQVVPAQRLEDFVNSKTSTTLPKTSYQPGIESVELGAVLPDFIYKSLQEGFKAFGKKMQGYLTNEAVVHATESRTSSPVRIPRDKITLEHIKIEGLYPCGEGAGYAGGIISAAIDGEKCAEKCCSRIQ